MPIPRADGPTPDPVMIRLAEGDETVVALLLDRHWAAVVGYASGILGSSDLAQDVAQEAFVRLWDRRASWTAGHGPRPILFRIARNLALDLGRADRNLTPWAPDFAPPDPAPLAPDRLEADELAAAIDGALARLNDREREVVVLSRIHGLSRSEIATVTGLRPGSVSNLLSVGMLRLARSLAPYLGTAGPAPAPRRLRRA